MNHEAHTGTDTGTRETGLPSTEASSLSTAMPLESNGIKQKRLAFMAKLKSFEENENLATIRETIAVIEPPLVEENSIERQPDSSMTKVKSQPNLLLTVSMPYGSYFGHQSPPAVLTRSHPNLKVTISLASLHQESETKVTKMTSTSDLAEEEEISLREENESAEDEDELSDEEVSSYSSCSAGSNSTCSSSYDENCPHCVISVRTKGTYFNARKDPEVFL